MKIYLLRHGETEYNAQKRYQGSRDIPLSLEGRKKLICADISPDTVYVSPLCRAVQTAQVLFPRARQIPVPDFREMDFGIFEGRSAREMVHDPEYRAWVDSGCEERVPGGERKKEFCARVWAAFEPLMDQAQADKKELLVILAHGGTQMAVMERCALPHREYFEWIAPNAGGFVLDDVRWKEERTLVWLETVQYTKGGMP